MTISLEHVTRYNGAQGKRTLVLDDVTVSFPSNQTVGILGTRGSGKSTLIRLLSGAAQPNRGTVRRSGTVSYPIAYAGGCNRFMTGRENANFLARIYGVPARDVIGFVERFSSLGVALDDPLTSYSGEKRARFMFSLSYALPFDTFIGDETLFGGPPAFRTRCVEHVRSLQRRASFVIATRSPVMVKEFCSMAGILDGGKITMYDDVRRAILDFRRLSAAQDFVPDGVPAASDDDGPEPEMELDP